MNYCSFAPRVTESIVDGENSILFSFTFSLCYLSENKVSLVDVSYQEVIFYLSFVGDQTPFFILKGNVEINYFGVKFSFFLLLFFLIEKV